MLKASWLSTYPLKKEVLISILLPKYLASKANLILNISFIVAYATIYILFIKKKLSALKACVIISFISPVLMAHIYPWHYLIFIGLLFASESYMLALLLASCLFFIAPINLFSFLILFIALWLIINIFKTGELKFYEKIKKFKLV